MLAQVVSADVVTTQVVAAGDAAPAALNNDVAPSRPGLIRRLWGAIYRGATWLFGVVSLVFGLAIVASIPIAQFASLGYLLEVCGRVARTGRVRSGWIGIDKGARLGSIGFGLILLLAPLRLLASLASPARLIDTGGSRDRLLTGLLVAAAALGVVHFFSALWRGGRMRHFLWPAPIKTVRLLAHTVRHPLATYVTVRDATYDFLVSLRLPYYFWLGLRGAVGGLLWLLIPVGVIAVGRKYPVMGVVGGVLFAVVILYLPFVQGRFAAENRFGAMFEVGKARHLFRRAPLMFVLALLLTLALNVPLYVLKVELIPADAAWLACLLFVFVNWPARLFTGWALARGTRREKPRNFFIRQGSRLVMLALAAAYTFIVYLSQFVSWYGVDSLYAQHPFLVPVPFFTFQSP